MPNLKLFKRRSSGSNALDTGFPTDPPPGGSSFRVLERPERSSHTHGAPPATTKSGRTFQSPLNQIRGKSADDLGLGANRSVVGKELLGVNEALKRDRGSGGTTNSGSSGYYDSSSASARHSSSSTLPSSVDQEREADHEELYPRKQQGTPMQHQMTANTNDDRPLPPPPSFKMRAAQTFSFGQKHNRSPSVQHDTAPSPISPSTTSQRFDGPNSPQPDRSTTTSSYASTAKPSDRDQDFSLGVTNFGDDFGSDFGNMFSGVAKSAGRSREDLGMPPAPGGFHRTESEPMYPPRALSRQAVTPSPNGFRNNRDNTASPYSFDRRDSQDGLMSSSALSSPRLFDDAPPVPTHGNGIAPAFLGKGKSGYALVPERNPSPGLERNSSDSPTDYVSDQEKHQEQGYNSRQTQLDDGDRWGRKVDLRAPQHQTATASASNKSIMTVGSGATDRTLRAPAQATAGASMAGAISPGSEEGGSIFGTESISTTPRAAKVPMYGVQDEPLFESSPQGPPSRALRPGHSRTESGTPRKMTKAQFDALQRSGEDSLDHSEDEGHGDEDYDDGDDVERSKQIARQRRKQEATMAVYRQKMKKSTAGGPADLHSASRPAMDRAAASAPALHMGGIGGTPPADALRGKPSDDEDEDVPLGVLQAHGFPSSSRPPTRLGDGERRLSLAGSVLNGGAGQGNLPPFARRLPQDPYFGSSLVSPANREPLAFSSAQSAYGGQMQQPQMAHPGGLVGVIASEERAKASRRGSPNPITGGYGMPVPGQAPSMPRSMSMGSMAAPSVYTPSGYMAGMPPMPLMPPMMPGMQGMLQMMPQDQNGGQMQQFMQMQMQLMQNMLTMQQQHLGQATPQPQQQAQDYLGVPFAGQRPMSMASQAPTFQNGLANQGRAMTMMSPSSSWDLGPNAQRPTSAMPSGYGLHPPNLGGPGPGYTPSIAPSERSNIGMPTRYRPVATGNEAAAGRSQSLTSTNALNAFADQQGTQNLRPEVRQTDSKSTIRLIDKPKGTPKASARPMGDEEEDDGWADMVKKRTEKKFGRRRPGAPAGQQEQSLSDLYKSYE
ncbi:hypothetical protein LTR53_015195 [Teratosphaeriaceae sp. CCFEE 6253]|nr:hypothetical protein LTR53_015195 [Teratosphaeriaceae sp. CCFEE 6253]